MIYITEELQNFSFMNYNQVVAVTTIRLVLGFIFLMQGFGKVFTWGVEKVYHMDFFYDTLRLVCAGHRVGYRYLRTWSGCTDMGFIACDAASHLTSCPITAS